MVCSLEVLVVRGYQDLKRSGTRSLDVARHALQSERTGMYVYSTDPRYERTARSMSILIEHRSWAYHGLPERAALECYDCCEID